MRRLRLLLELLLLLVGCDGSSVDHLLLHRRRGHNPVGGTTVLQEPDAAGLVDVTIGQSRRRMRRRSSSSSSSDLSEAAIAQAERG